MSGFEYIAPSASLDKRPEFDKLSIAVAAPRAYLAQHALADHLLTAMWHPVLDLQVREHVNEPTGTPFQCIAYYADDRDVIAHCLIHDGVHLAMIGAPFVRRLVKICHQLGPVLARRPRVPKRAELATATLERDPVLGQLINGELAVSELEALAIVSSWPSAKAQSLEIELGEYALFHDLIRLIWLHEWAHALCGHVGFAATALGLGQLHEFSADRPGAQTIESVGYPRHEVLQALELHADEFATRYCVTALLWGYDPVGQIAGPKVDLIDRLLIFNVACCVFAVLWSVAEQRFAPGESFYPPRPDLASEEPDPLFQVFKTTHPPAALRYMRFRDFQRDLTWEYGRHAGPTLSPSVDAASFGFLDTLAEINPHFYDLRNQTPVAVQTPRMKRLTAYEAHLLEIGMVLAPFITATGFRPTVDPDKL